MRRASISLVIAASSCIQLSLACISPPIACTSPADCAAGGWCDNGVCGVGSDDDDAGSEADGGFAADAGEVADGGGPEVSDRDPIDGGVVGEGEGEGEEEPPLDNGRS